MRIAVLAAAGLMAMVLAAPSASSASSALVAHRAVYDLSLKDASESSGISAMAGRMVYEFKGSPCEGYTVNFRFVTEIDNGGMSRITDQQTKTFEDIREGVFRFSTRSYVNQDLEREVKGTAEAGSDGVRVEIVEPEEQELVLAKALFPTEHMIELIAEANKGVTFYQSHIFDGSDGAAALMITNTVIGDKSEAAKGDAEAGKAGELADDAFWPVSIAYFDDDKEGDALPVYTIAFKLYENGVTRDLTMDYGDFVLEGKLASLDTFGPAVCDK